MTRLRMAAGAAILALAAAPASAAQLRVTISNLSPAGGFSFTPLYASFHDGGFDAFDAGSAASPGVERLAELGDPSVVRGERLAADPESVGGGIASPSGPPPIQPGESATREFSVDGAENRYFSFLSMFVPTNDLFIGNDDPLAYELFDAAGAFTGPLTISVFGRSIWDAGTEVNDPLDGGAFVQGVDATLGTDEGGVVGLFFSRASAANDLSLIVGLNDATGAEITSAFGPDDLLAQVRVSQVPLPGALPMLAVGLASLVAMRRVRRS